MAILFTCLLVLHGLIHLLGAAKAFGWAELPQLTQPVSPAAGAGWFASGLLFVATAIALFVSPRGWWIMGASAVVLSTILIVSSWNDAKAGAWVNVVVLAVVVVGFLSQGPFSLRAEYDRDIDRQLAIARSASVVTDADLVHLPAPVQRYLRVTGVVGQPRVGNFRVRMHGRIRNGPHDRWMSIAGEQYNVLEPPARLFFATASMFAMPAQGYHRYVGSSASMRVRVGGVVPVVTAAGTEMTKSETVTLFNDMCVMAPATLIDPSISWEALDSRRSRAGFTNAGHTIHAELVFNDAGELIDFVSADRSQVSADGTTLRQVRWSTPVEKYRTFGAVRLVSRGEGRWHEPEGEYVYIELTIDDVQYNVPPPRRQQSSGSRRSPQVAR